MIKVETYIKDKDEFILISDYKGVVSSAEYVEGAIYLKVDEKEILTLNLWDDVNWLWGYIVTGFEDLIEESEWTTAFPGQPIDLTFSINRDTKKNDIEVFIPESGITAAQAEVRRATADLSEFLTKMNEAGQEFFLCVQEIGGESGEREARRLQEAITKLQSH